MSPYESSAQNTSAWNTNTKDPLFYVCWRRQSCSQCLSEDAACSWCAISSSCVPSEGRVPILAPILSDQICPLGSKERWELRARPLGCNVSTLTVLSTSVAISSTLALAGMVLLVVWLARRVRRRLKQTEFERLDGESEEIWWRKWVDWAPLSSLAGAFSQGQGLMQGQEANRDSMEEDQEDGERRPLLE